MALLPVCSCGFRSSASVLLPSVVVAIALACCCSVDFLVDPMVGEAVEAADKDDNVNGRES